MRGPRLCLAIACLIPSACDRVVPAGRAEPAPVPERAAAAAEGPADPVSPDPASVASPAALAGAGGPSLAAGLGPPGTNGSASGTVASPHVVRRGAVTVYAPVGPLAPAPGRAGARPSRPEDGAWPPADGAWPREPGAGSVYGPGAPPASELGDRGDRFRGGFDYRDRGYRPRRDCTRAPGYGYGPGHGYAPGRGFRHAPRHPYAGDCLGGVPWYGPSHYPIPYTTLPGRYGYPYGAPYGSPLPYPYAYGSPYGYLYDYLRPYPRYGTEPFRRYEGRVPPDPSRRGTFPDP